MGVIGKMNSNINLISVLTGGFLIVSSVILLGLKRISLDRVGSNPNLKEQEVKAEILNLIKFSSNIPALGLFLIGMVLILVPVYLSSKMEPDYTVKGVVKKQNNPDASNIIIATKYPPHSPEMDGKIVNFTVTRNSQGVLPTLSFNHPDYRMVGVDLNDGDEVEIVGNIIKIRNDIILHPAD